HIHSSLSFALSSLSPPLLLTRTAASPPCFALRPPSLPPPPLVLLSARLRHPFRASYSAWSGGPRPSGLRSRRRIVRDATRKGGGGRELQALAGAAAQPLWYVVRAPPVRGRHGSSGGGGSGFEGEG
ncbi:unnamed protein product, partial [Urochloa humidicola]